MIESPDASGDGHIHRKYGNFVIFVYRRNGVDIRFKSLNVIRTF